MIWRDRRDRPLHELSMPGLVRAYRRIDQSHDGPAGRAEQLDALAVEVLRRTPDAASFWFDRAMFAKWRRDWTASRDLGQHGLDLIPADQCEGEPMAWNLGIAATALRDWQTARLAWAAFGIPLDGDDDAPISADFGPCPVRLNPDPRFVGEPELTVDGERWDPEVVWGLRLDPARIQIHNVPLPTSGHRYGDVVLHDGDPNGSRQLDGQEVPVFDEILLWERSPVPTCSVALAVADDDALGELLADLDAVGLTGEDWTTSLRMLCAACSSGSPGAHEHPFGTASGEERTVGISGRPEDITPVLRGWRSRGADRSCGEVVVELA